MRTSSAYRPPRRLKNPERIEFFKTATLDGKYDLDAGEKAWRDRSEFLEARGYMLRPRFRKGWKPSWLGTDLHPEFCEDSHRLISIRIIDATRISDGKRVVLKRVRRVGTEVGLAQSLHLDGRSEDPDNHCVPILEYFDDMEDRRIGFIVMPLLRKFDDPEFAFINEVLDFIHQTLIGLRYLHRRKIAHRDLSGLNIMMDGDSLYPLGFHPSHQFMNPVTTAFAEYRNRREAPPVKYYIIDFGESSAFDDEGSLIEHFDVHRQSPEVPPDPRDVPYVPQEEELTAEEIADAEARIREIAPNLKIRLSRSVKVDEEPATKLPPFRVLGRDALDKEVPELSTSVPYDPFKVDIFTLGNVYKKTFIQKYSNLSFLLPLVELMTQIDPKMRPSADEALHKFDEIRPNITPFQQCLPLRPVEEPRGRYYNTIEDMKAIIRECWMLTGDNLKKLLPPQWVLSLSVKNYIPRFRPSAAATT